MMRSPIWRSPKELVSVGFHRSRVVMLNEAHNGLRRSVRSRCVGKDVLAAAHESGVRALAMEALSPMFAQECNRSRAIPDWPLDGYLGQPEMKDLVRCALDLGWRLIPYEVDDSLTASPSQDHRSLEYTNWREEQQARNLIEALESLSTGSRLLVWCGNGHHGKTRCQDWVPMGCRFSRLSGIEPFAIDQTITVKFEPDDSSFGDALVTRFEGQLLDRDRTAGFLREEGPEELLERTEMDAFILSLDNDLT